MPKRFQQLTLRERLAAYPPWLVLALSHVRTERQTREECQRRLWSAVAKKKRWELKQSGQVPPRKPTWRRLTYQEIAERGARHGLKHKTVRWIVRHLTWDNLTVAHMLAFTEACGLSLTSATHIKLLKFRMAYQLKQGRPFLHLTTSQRRELEKMLARWKKIHPPGGQTE